MTRDGAKALAESYKFDHFGFFDAKKLNFMPEVRGMCKTNQCGQYGRTWTCPPNIPELEEISAQAGEYDWGLLLQTTAMMEDPFDAETMEEAAATQTKSFHDMVAKLRKEGEDILPMGSGGCGGCKTCAFPNSCVKPERAIPSMEAYGLMVSDVCTLADTPYYYGRNTITFTSCILFKD